MMNKLMNWMMLSCKKTTELIEKDSLVGLTVKEKFRLRLHASMCDGCSAYLKQSIFIDKFLAHHITKSDTSNTSDDNLLQDRIISKLADNN